MEMIEANSDALLGSYFCSLHLHLSASFAPRTVHDYNFIHMQYKYNGHTMAILPTTFWHHIIRSSKELEQREGGEVFWVCVR